MLSEPLVSVAVGRLVRRLESPSRLQPTPDRGTLSLWLLSNDDLLLVFQGRQRAAPPTHMCSLRDELEETTMTTVWEELARFPAGAHLLADQPRE